MGTHGARPVNPSIAMRIQKRVLALEVAQVQAFHPWATSTRSIATRGTLPTSTQILALYRCGVGLSALPALGPASCSCSWACSGQWISPRSSCRSGESFEHHVVGQMQRQNHLRRLNGGAFISAKGGVRGDVNMSG